MSLAVSMSFINPGGEATSFALGRSTCSEIFLAVGFSLACWLRPRVLLAAEDPDEERKPPSLEGFRGVLDWSEVADDKVCCRRGVLPSTKEDEEVIVVLGTRANPGRQWKGK